MGGYINSTTENNDTMGYVNDSGNHQNHLNFIDWKYKLNPIWDADNSTEGTTLAIGQLNVPNDIMENSAAKELDPESESIQQVVQTPLPTTVDNKTITFDRINYGVINSLRINAAAIAANFEKTSGSLSSLPIASKTIIDNDDNASSGTTTAGGDGILDAILGMEGENIMSPDEFTLIDKSTWESAATELERLAVYANYANYANSGYAQYAVYYTDHANTGHNKYNDYSDYSQTSGSGWWCCYRQHSNSNSGHTRYGDYTQSGENSDSGYTNYNVSYSNYTNNYGDYSKTNNI